MTATADIDLRWLVSFSASCLYAADVLRRRGQLADLPLNDSVAGPLDELRRWLLALEVPEDRFFPHVVALSAGIENNQQLAREALRKTLGPIDCEEFAVSGLAGALGGLEAAVRRTYPALVDDLAERGQRWMESFEPRLSPLLEAIAAMADQRLVVSRAEVVLVWPAQGGGGCACLPYNRVIMEVNLEEPASDLPKFLHLVWLLSQLNIDLPIFSETIPRDRLPRLAELAMLPAVLTAAQHQQVVVDAQKLLPAALAAWCGHDAAAKDAADSQLVTTLWGWWQTCRQRQFDWPVALAALNHVLGSGEFGVRSAECGVKLHVNRSATRQQVILANCQQLRFANSALLA